MGQAEEGCAEVAHAAESTDATGSDESGLDAALRGWSAEVLATRLAALQRVTAALSAVQLPAEAAEVVLTRGLSALGAVAGSIRLLSEDGLWLDLLGTSGFVKLRTPPGRRSIAEHDPLAEAVRTGAPIWLRSSREWQTRFSDSAANIVAGGYFAGAVLPLIVDGKAVGATTIIWGAEQLFDLAERAFITALAQQAAQAIARTRLYVRERERARAAEELVRLQSIRAEEARALATVSAALSGTLDPEQLYIIILEQATRVLPCDHAAVMSYADGVATFVATRGTPCIEQGCSYAVDELWLPTGDGPSYVPDTDAIPDWCPIPPLTGPLRERSILAVPLIIDGRHVGSFDVSSRAPGRYTDRHLEVVAAFGERAAYALRNARLYAAERARARAAEELVGIQGGLARQAEQLAQMQSDFVAAVSHELRTPLTGVVGYAELLQAHWDRLSPEKRWTYLQRIVQSAARQQRLVEDLLLLGKLENSMFSVQSAPAPLADLVQQAAGEVQGSYRGQRIAGGGPQDLRVLADPARTVQIVVNLLDNAAKYSPEGSAIDVFWRAEAGMAALRVRDHGPGIPDAARGMLFTRFGRVPESRMRAGRTGTGLGLYLGRKLAQAMGGDLDLDQSGPGGSTFRLCLPLAGGPPSALP